MGLFLLFSPKVWLIIGFSGQALFTVRFVVQWLVSEKKRDSVVPEAFWWLSLLGGLTLLLYANLPPRSRSSCSVREWVWSSTCGI